MQITITARHLTLPPLSKEMLTSKAEKLERFGHQLLALHAVLAKEKYLFTSELTLSCKGVRLVGKGKHAGDLLTCIEEALSKLETQLKRRQDKQVVEKRRRVPHRPA